MSKKEFKELLKKIMLEDYILLRIERDDEWCKAIVYNGYSIYVYMTKHKNVVIRKLASTEGVTSRVIYYFDDEGNLIKTSK